MKQLDYTFSVNAVEDMTAVYVLAAAITGAVASGLGPKEAAKKALRTAQELGKLINKATKK